MTIQLDVGALGIVGVAEEATPGTFTAATKFFAIKSESLKYEQATEWQETIRGISDVISAVPGNSHVQGDITMDLLPGVLPYFLRCSRNTLTVTGTAAPYTYVSTPSHSAQPTKTMSISVLRNGQWFGYAGCVVSEMEMTIDGKLAEIKFVIVGRSENDAIVAPTVSMDTADEPFGAGQYDIQIPTATQVFDADKIVLTVNDAAKPEFRLQNAGTGPQYVLFGKRTVGLKVDRDFDEITDYNNFKTLTAGSITVQASQSANASVAVKLANTVAKTYDIGNLTGQATLVRSSIDYTGMYDPTTQKSYEFTVVCGDGAA